MKKLIPILSLFISFSAFAQRVEQIEERIKAQKIAFISDKVQLTSEEAQQFWPIYNAFEAKIESIKSGDLRRIKQEMRRGNVSDDRADELLAEILNAENKMHEAKMQLVKDLKEVISSQKIMQLKAAEDQFNRVLIERLKKVRDQRARNRN